MLKLMSTVALILVATSLIAAEPVPFTVEVDSYIPERLHLRIGDWDVGAKNASYDEAKGTLVLTGSVDMWRKTKVNSTWYRMQGERIELSVRDGSVRVDGRIIPGDWARQGN